MHSQGNAAFSEGVTIHPDGSITGTLAGCVRSYAARAAETEPADPIGVLVDGSTVFCFGCELLNAHKVFLYRVNVYPYKQACTKCGKALVEPQSPRVGPNSLRGKGR